MDARWKGIPFRANSGPVSPVLDEEPPYGDMDPDPRQDAGLYSAYSEHDHGSIAPESLGPPQCIGRITTQPATRKDPTNIEEVKHPPDVQTAKPRRRIWRILRRYWICILAMVMILGLALGLGLGLTIGRNVQGAMEGTGLAALDLRDGSSKITLYFQDRSGHIRVSQYENGVWTG